MKLAGLFLAAVIAAGCDPVSVTALTVAPLGKTALLDDESLELELSRGIAIGFECTINTTTVRGPCNNPRAKIGDEEVALAFSSYLDTTLDAWDGGYAGPRTRTAFVVVGRAVGETELEVITTEADITLSVTIVP